MASKDDGDFKIEGTVCIGYKDAGDFGRNTTYVIRERLVQSGTDLSLITFNLDGCAGRRVKSQMAAEI